MSPEDRTLGRAAWAAICAVEGLIVPKNIFAYTPPGSEPPYISINETNGVVTVTVRSTKELGGATAAIVLSDDKLTELAVALFERER